MPINKEEIKKALDDFENDKFVDAKEKIQKELNVAKNEFLQKKLGLTKSIEPVEKQVEKEKEEQVKDGEE